MLCVHRSWILNEIPGMRTQRVSDNSFPLFLHSNNPVIYLHDCIKYSCLWESGWGSDCHLEPNELGRDFRVYPFWLYTIEDLQCAQKDPVIASDYVRFHMDSYHCMAFIFMAGCSRNAVKDEQNLIFRDVAKLEKSRPSKWLTKIRVRVSNGVRIRVRVRGRVWVNFRDGVRSDFV